MNCLKCKKPIDITKSHYMINISDMNNENCSSTTSIRKFHIDCGKVFKSIFLLSSEFKTNHDKFWIETNINKDIN